jgi:hypothetical protein
MTNQANHRQKRQSLREKLESSGLAEIPPTWDELRGN